MDKQTLHEFVLQAQKILEEKKVRKNKSLYIGALNREVKIESLTQEEIDEWINFRKQGKKQDSYLCYIGSPTLRELAVELVNLGQIDDYLEVVNILKSQDQIEIAKQILEISGVFDKTTVKEVDSLKK